MEVDSNGTDEQLGPPPALRALLHNIVDYAGQFPPARLSLEDAAENFARYRQGPQAWMLGRFVHPASQIGELHYFAHLFRNDPPFRLSLLGTGGDDAETFLEAFARDVENIHQLHEEQDDRAYADVMEVRLPPPLLDADRETLASFLDGMYRHIVMTGLSKLDLFFEIPLQDPALQHLPTLLRALDEYNHRQPEPLRSEAGLKIRCGGLDPEDVPSVAHVARALQACRAADVRFKATAGLHHPVRHYNKDADMTMHGFFNLFVAAVMNVTHDLDTALLEQILADEDEDHFSFDNNKLMWNDLSASLESILEVREQQAISFGSCSFDEPREDLDALGLL